MESLWAISLDAASCLRIELTLFTFVLISYLYLMPLGTNTKAKKSVKTTGHWQNKKRNQATVAPKKSRNATIMAAKFTGPPAIDTSATRTTQFLEDMYPRVNSQHLGMHLEAAPTSSLPSTTWGSDDESTVASDTPTSVGRSSDEEVLSDNDSIESWNGIAQRVTQVFRMEIDSQHDDEFFASVDGRISTNALLNRTDEEQVDIDMDSWRSLSSRFANALSEAEDDDERSSLDSWQALSRRLATAFSDVEEDEEDN